MLTVYRALINLVLIFSPIIIIIRLLKKKEDIIRFKEKFGFFSKKRTKGKLIWFHGASVGEIQSIIPLLEKFEKNNKISQILITSNTLSSSKILKNLKLRKIVHQFFPIDTNFISENFIKYWKPSKAFFIDSEIWPNMIYNLKKNKIPIILLNGRITKKTFNKWNIFPNFAKKVFSNFDLCLSCSEESKLNLQLLQVKKLIYIGNLKFSIRIKKMSLNDANIQTLNNFKVWCAVSTHEGEEIVAIKTHLEIKKKYKDVITIIIPRHINRTPYIEKLTTKFNLNAQILNDEEHIKAGKEVLIINSFGVLHKYFNYCKNIFIGKSLIKNLEKSGGQNPIEAAKFNCKIYYGPYVYNFKEVYDFLKTNDIAQQIRNEYELSKKIIENIDNTKITYNENISLLDRYGDEILEKTIVELNKFIKIKNENS